MNRLQDRAVPYSRSPLSRFFALNGSNKRVLVEALLSLVLASVAIRILPFRRTAAWMSSAPGRVSEQANHEQLVNQCRWAVLTWADRVPWRAVCFQRGLALHVMLRRRGIPSTLNYGVAHGGAKGLRAHVWLSTNGRMVLGGEDAPAFTCLAVFPASGQG
jgi:hypothetical protein